jgi:hypothetical protein
MVSTEEKEEEEERLLSYTKIIKGGEWKRRAFQIRKLVTFISKN